MSKECKAAKEYGSRTVTQDTLCDETRQMTGRSELNMLAVRYKC